ncbi:hypothetical protein Pyn_04048 [Prunus yedoensis var. nudiflora]|uniref:Uncharacterized protein n=1 Tax=Prunus yedoensis var. nudiflora TaxID=2094558 RepID=A0A314UF11_PRUYE|nr:hypothetical protein Pyn_04048 [Prunus yedoensis var. nudiflora]
MKFRVSGYYKPGTTVYALRLVVYLHLLNSQVDKGEALLTAVDLKQDSSTVCVAVMYILALVLCAQK